MLGHWSACLQWILPIRNLTPKQMGKEMHHVEMETLVYLLGFGMLATDTIILGRALICDGRDLFCVCVY